MSVLTTLFLEFLVPNSPGLLSCCSLHLSVVLCSYSQRYFSTTRRPVHELLGVASFIWLKLRGIICWFSSYSPSSHIPSLSIAPTVTRLAYIRIYRTPKNKKG